MTKESVEFDLRVGRNGDLLIPKNVLDRLKIRDGSRLHVRLTTKTLSEELKARHVTEEEIESVAALQLEPRENVVKFLSTESGLSGNTRFLARVRKLGSRR